MSINETTAEQLSVKVAYTVFLSMACLQTPNEFGDQSTVHNTLTDANTLQQAIKRTSSIAILRAVYYTATSITLPESMSSCPVTWLSN